MPKSFVASANGDNVGPLKGFLRGLARRRRAAAAQEHRALAAKLPQLERDLQDMAFMVCARLPTLLAREARLAV